MKFFKKILIWLTIFLWIFFVNDIAFSDSIQWLNNVKWWVPTLAKDNNIWEMSKEAWYKFINWFRYIFSAVLVIYIVYAWIQMILSQGTDDDSLNKSKTSLWHAVIGLIFVNFPVEIYQYMNWKNWNIFLALDSFSSWLLKYILVALQILIWWICIFILVFEWIQVIAKKDEEALNNAKNKIKWVVLWLIFIWFIELWRMFIITWDIWRAKWIFGSVWSLALYIAWPVALFFLSLAWYYYIFAWWDEEKAKKWKSIIINTSIWIILVLCVYILLNDISLLQF